MVYQKTTQAEKPYSGGKIREIRKIGAFLAEAEKSKSVQAYRKRLLKELK